MLNNNQLFRLLNEMVFLLVGALLVWVGLFGGQHLHFFNPRQPSWLILTGVLMLWGLRTWRKAPRIPAGGERAVNAVWTYEAPYEAVAAIRNHLAFYPERVDAIEEHSKS